MKEEILMKTRVKIVLPAVLCVFILLGAGVSSALAANAIFDVSKMSDMSDFDANKWANPSGDTIKIGLMDPFSGPGAGNGEIYFLVATWVAHDLNKRGGIKVDGKMKKIELIKGDTLTQPAKTKKEAERLCLEEKVDALHGTTGSHISVVIQSVAEKYKKIYVNTHALSDVLMNGKNFNRYTFRTLQKAEVHGAALGYFYKHRWEKKFYILCQDYTYGHSMAEGFKAALKKYRPDAEIVGEDYHPLFLKDFAPYLTKIQASGAEVIYSADWMPDGGNMITQARSLGIYLPIANIYMNEPNSLSKVGPRGTEGMVNAYCWMVPDKDDAAKQYTKKWNDQWQKWNKPYNTPLYKWPGGVLGDAAFGLYWLFSVMERAGTTDPEKVIAQWEGDEFETIWGVKKMRACDHETIQDMYVTEYIYPNAYYDDQSSQGFVFRVPAQFATPSVAPDLERCKK